MTTEYTKREYRDTPGRKRYNDSKYTERESTRRNGYYKDSTGIY